MSTQGVMFTGSKQIMDAFDRQENPFFSVWNGRDLLFSHNVNDIDKARGILAENLMALEHAQNTDSIKIKFHPGKDGKYINDKTPVTATMYVRAFALPSPGYMIPHNGGMGSVQNDLLLERLSGIENMLKNRNEFGEGDYDEDSEQQKKLDRIGQMAETVDQIVSIPTVALLLNKILGLQAPPAAAVTASVAGIPETEKFTGSIEVLQAADPELENDLYLLASLAKHQPEHFKVLLGVLRNMFKQKTPGQKNR